MISVFENLEFWLHNMEEDLYYIIIYNRLEVPWSSKEGYYKSFNF